LRGTARLPKHNARRLVAGGHRTDGEILMAMIRWDQSMTTGVDTIDDQHKQLITWLNDPLAAMSQGKGRAEVQRLLDDLGTYASTHFGHEEECMQRYKCPAAQANVAAHREFVQIFDGFKAEFEHGGATVYLLVRIESELMRWLTGHIRRTDTLLYACVKPLAKIA